MTNISITDPGRVLPIFVNELIGSGHLNGVINLTFGTCLWTPNTDGTKVDTDLIVSCRLRMDLYAAQHLYERLGGIIAANSKPEGVKAN